MWEMMNKNIFRFLCSIILFPLFACETFAFNAVTTSVSSYATRGALTRELIRTPNGNLVIFYWNNTIKYKVSENNGTSWSIENSLTSSYYGGSYATDIVCDISNNIYVNYVEGGYGTRQLKFCKLTWNGSSYTKEAPFFIQSDPDASGYPQYWNISMVIDKDGKFWIAYRIYNDGFNNGKGLVVLSSPDGETWTHNWPAAVTTTLSADINTSSTTITVASGTGLVAGSGIIRIGSEWIAYMGLSGNVLTGCIRGKYAPVAKLNAQIDSAATTITVNADLSSPVISLARTNFAASGTIKIDGEWISYSGISGGAFTGCTRGTYTRSISLAGDINTTVTTITASGDVLASGFASSGLFRIGTEWISYTGLGASNTEFRGCTRGAIGSTAASHTGGDTITQGEASQHNVNTYLYQAELAHSNGASVTQPVYPATTTSHVMVKWNDYPALFYNNGTYWKYFDGSVWQVPSSALAALPLTYSVTVTEDNYLHCVTWEPGTGIRTTSHDNTTVSTWTSWVTLQVPDASSSGVNPSITTNGEDLWCFWNKYSSTTSYDVVYKKAVKSGSSWTWDSTETTVTTNGFKNVGVDTLLDSKKIGTIPVVWTTEPVSPFTVNIGQIATPLQIKSFTPGTTTNLSTSTISIRGLGFYGANTAASIATIKLSNGISFSSFSILDDLSINPAILPSGVPVGTYQIIVENTSGSLATSTGSVTITTAVPTVTIPTPSIGPDNGYRTIAIAGTGFFGGTASTNVTAITIDNGTQLYALIGYSVSSDSTIVNALSPVGCVVNDNYNVRVTTSGGANATSSTKYTVAAGPVITSTTPVSGTNSNPVTLSINGSNFGGFTSVMLDDAGSTVLTGAGVSGTTIITNAVVPANVVAGSYNIRVTAANGTNITSAAKYQVTVGLHTISNVAPVYGSNTGSTSTTITGLGFYGGSINTPAITQMTLKDANSSTTITISGFSVISDSQINSILVPVGLTLGTYDFILKNPDAVPPDTIPDANSKFQIKSGPTVTSISPSSMANTTVLTMTVTGTGFFVSGSSAVTKINLNDPQYTQFTALTCVMISTQ